MDDDLSPEQRQAFDVIAGLCGGTRYVRITARSANWLEVEAECSDDNDGIRSITIGIDGRVSPT